MADFGELVLVLGDLHIPQRAALIPEVLKRLLVPNKMQHVICTGNCTTKEQQDELKALAPNVHIVKGEFDDDQTLPESKVIQIGQFKFGLIHGHQIVPWGDEHSLAVIQRQLDCDVLVTGNTHKHAQLEFEGKWFINPGSITGAYSTLTPDAVPSFILLAVSGSKIISYCYEWTGGEKPAVTKLEIQKQ